MFPVEGHRHLVYLPYAIERQPQFDKEALNAYIAETARDHLNADHQQHLTKNIAIRGSYPWKVGWGYNDYQPLNGIDTRFPDLIDYVRSELCFSRIRKFVFLSQTDKVWVHQDTDEDGWGIRLHLWNNTPERMFFQKVRPAFAEKHDIANRMITGFELPWFGDEAINHHRRGGKDTDAVYTDILDPEKFYIRLPTPEGAFGLSNRWAVHGTDPIAEGEDKCVLVIYGEKDINRLRDLHERSLAKYRDYAIFWN